MSNVVAPAAFNEPFTLRLDGAGEPVRRTLNEMSADDVVDACRWAAVEENRLGQLLAPWESLPGETDEGWISRIALKPGFDLEMVGSLLTEAGEAQARLGRLLHAVRLVLTPQWREHPDVVGLGEAVRRWWPT